MPGVPKSEEFVDETKTQLEKQKSASPRWRCDSSDTAESDGQVTAQTALHIAADNLIRSAHHESAIGTFWDAYATCASGTGAADASAMTSQKWLQAAVQEAHSDPTLRSALLSIALGRINRATEDEYIKRQATLHYNISISNIRKALDHPERQFDDTLLAAVMVLGAYEIHECSQDELQLAIRGSRNFKSDFAKSLYFGHAMNELINAIGSRNRTRLQHPNALPSSRPPGLSLLARGQTVPHPQPHSCHYPTR